MSVLLQAFQVASVSLASASQTLRPCLSFVAESPKTTKNLAFGSELEACKQVWMAKTFAVDSFHVLAEVSDVIATGRKH